MWHQFECIFSGSIRWMCWDGGYSPGEEEDGGWGEEGELDPSSSNHDSYFLHGKDYFFCLFIFEKFWPF